MSTTQPVVLIILDGFGINPRKEYNAIANASKPNLDALLRTYPNSRLSMSGVDVGLPAGQMGNSEVGHMILGAGRIVYQDLTLIHRDIAEGGFYHNGVLLDALRKTKAKSDRLHLMGLLGDGGVHSHQLHMEAIVEMAKREKLGQVYLHLFLDGRDTPPNSAEQFMLDLNGKLKTFPNVKIATVSGRYYAMDRDKRWDRVEKAYACLTQGIGNQASSALEAIRNSYKEKVTDEFVLPTTIAGVVPDGLMRDGDGVIFFNFRADRARELTRALTDGDFKEFPRSQRIELCSYTTMTQYDETFKHPVAYQPREIRKILGEVASQAGVKQLRIAETEKYAHVTYFFNGGAESKFSGEERILIPSPKDVATYDLKPEMSARPVTEALVRYLGEQDVGLVIANYANADMVGHTGNFEASVKAVEVIDECLGRVVDAVLGKKGKLIITADHGNIEQLIDYDTGMPHTAHTLNLVPVILIDEAHQKCRLNQGTAIDVAPTVMQLLGLPMPAEMTGHSLIVEA
ncbi:MAG: phosphoglycerate mutase, 2,3-bisphosphoglycerate-independent [Deltaproteobacteria bacterium]|nr:phosphoglycerate mutase, 2,3-bisphosphoglycerate-independent [Deltaproteobacteria bacterium]